MVGSNSNNNNDDNKQLLLFYSTFSKQNISRESLIAQLPENLPPKLYDKLIVKIDADITRPISQMTDEAKRVMDFYCKNEEYLGLQFLDKRITKKADDIIIAGFPRKQLLSGQMGLDGKVVVGRRWKIGGQSYLEPNYTHQDYLDAIGNNKEGVRLCSSHVDVDKKCGSCFMSNGGSR